MASVLITGASSGFGAAAARKYAAEGRDVIVAARRRDRIDALVDELGDKTRVHGVELDVRDRDAVFALPGELPEPFRDVHIVVNNAGLAKGLEGGDAVDIDDWEVMVDTNVKGLMYVTRAFLPGMAERGGGHIVNIGSVAASWPYPGGNAYGGTKAFVQQFSRNLRSDLLGKNIRVSNIEPGMCETEFSVVRFDGDAGKASKVYEGMTPLAATDIAEIIYWVTALPPHINVNQLEVMPTEQAWSPFAVHRGDV
ncbi:MAG: SDR family NAD(P)-dependent oxidoreductase [Gammaproteobacteria bacterium]|nr:SDR family NAD(P)-dependent oxidoreductase [Gammaproteobacteria bacterium]